MKSGAYKDNVQAINGKLTEASGIMQGLVNKGHDINTIRIEYDRQIKRSETSVVNVPTNVRLHAREQIKYDLLTPTGKVFYLLIDDIIHSHRTKWSKGYIHHFATIRTKILGYEPNFESKMLTEKWWLGFVSHCIEDLGNFSNTINTDTKAIKALMKELGIPGHEKIKWSYSEPEILGLSWDKVINLQKVDLSSLPPGAQEARTIWLAGAFTGRRWEEISNATSDNFYQVGGNWRYKNIGKGNKRIDIRLLDEAVEFFQRIDFKIPKLAGQVVNRYIKLICQAAGYTDNILVIRTVSASKVIQEVKEEWETVHFHTGRHSYCHHIVELFAGKPGSEKTISWLMGHASFQTTWKYMNKSASSNEAVFNDVVAVTQVV